MSLSFKNTRHWIKADQIQDGLILPNLITSAKTLFQIRSHSQEPGVRAWTYLFGRHKPTTASLSTVKKKISSLVLMYLLFPKCDAAQKPCCRNWAYSSLTWISELYYIFLDVWSLKKLYTTPVYSKFSEFTFYNSSVSKNLRRRGPLF